jgi:predicted HTH domain antitoxin
MEMKNITIPVDISPEIMIALNENEQDLKHYFQIGIAIMLFQEGKLTIGKAIQLSGLTRFEFEKALAKKNIPVSNPGIDQIFSDMEKLGNL